MRGPQGPKGFKGEAGVGMPGPPGQLGPIGLKVIDSFYFGAVANKPQTLGLSHKNE